MRAKAARQGRRDNEPPGQCNMIVSEDERQCECLQLRAAETEKGRKNNILTDLHLLLVGGSYQ